MRRLKLEQVIMWPKSTRPARASVFACLGAVLLTAACDRPINSIFKKKQQLRTSQEELREELGTYADYMESAIRRATEELTEKSEGTRTKRLCLIWQMEIIPKAHNAMNQANPLACLLDLWTLALRQRVYLETGEGRTLFGAQQPIAVSAARDCEERVIGIADAYLNDAQLASARAKVAQLANALPIRGQFATPAVHIVEQAGEGDQVLMSILNIPLVPFRALEGVDRTADSIRGFTAVAGRMTGVVQGLAADARLNLQLLLLETEEMQTVQSVSLSLQEFAQSSKRFVEITEKLPEDLRVQLTSAIDDVNVKTSQLQTTLREARSTADQVEKTARTTAAAGDALADAAKSIEDMVASFREPADAAGKSANPTPTTTAEAGKAFDPNDYTRMADAFGASARELRNLSDEIRGLTRDPALDQRLADIESRLREVIQSGQATGRLVTDHLAWRLLELIGVIFVLAVIYRLVIVRALVRHA